VLRRAGERAPSSRVTSAAEASRLAADAYIFGYPLVLMDVTRHVATSTMQPALGRAPTNCFAHMRSLPDASYTDIVSPNADMLYSVAWLDLREQPMVLGLPEMGARYYLMQLLDGWTNVFADPGTRTTGGEPREFAIVGPDWREPVPPTLAVIRAPTNMVWLIGRTQTDGPHDYTNVHAAQDKYLLTPLSEWGTAYQPPIGDPHRGVDRDTPPAEQVARMDAITFFGCLNVLMQTNPPAPNDRRALARFELLGIRPGPPLAEDGLHPALGAGISAGRTQLLELSHRHVVGHVVNGWEFTPRDVGRYGTNYLLRAAIAMIGLGANLREDAIYSRAILDEGGQVLTGAKRYTITFPYGGLPPVSAFWSISLYNEERTFVENPLHRYAIGDRDGLTMNSDGSLTIYVQKESPGQAREGNWLPTAADSFNLIMRLYWPSASILEGRWTPPPVCRVG
jgi:hypothetical protein